MTKITLGILLVLTVMSFYPNTIMNPTSTQKSQVSDNASSAKDVSADASSDKASSDKASSAKNLAAKQAPAKSAIDTVAETSTHSPQDMVALRSIIPGIFLDIRYATTNNFTGEVLYDTAACFMRRGVAERLKQVWLDLRRQGYALKVFDAYRPYSVTVRMWELIRDPDFVATPKNGSRHNRGAAIDLTLVTLDGAPLEMPSDFDEFSERAHHDYSGASAVAQRHRALLRTTMRRHGFSSYSREWWHYDDVDWRKYPVIDIPLRTLLKNGR